MTPRDAPFILELLNDPAFVENIGDRNVRSLDDARAYIENGPAASYRRFGFGLWTVERKDGRTRIGICGLLKREALDDVDIGFAFLPAFRRKGYAFESAAAVRAHARDRLALRRLVAIVNPANARSIDLLVKLGFTRERLIRLSAEDRELALFGCAL
jgi:RimJ/RimL family protein N-acetyltransferase